MKISISSSKPHCRNSEELCGIWILCSYYVSTKFSGYAPSRRVPDILNFLQYPVSIDVALLSALYGLCAAGTRTYGFAHIKHDVTARFASRNNGLRTHIAG